jgi:hypothetical protein
VCCIGIALALHRHRVCVASASRVRCIGSACALHRQRVCVASAARVRCIGIALALHRHRVCVCLSKPDGCYAARALCSVALLLVRCCMRATTSYRSAQSAHVNVCPLSGRRTGRCRPLRSPPFWSSVVHCRTQLGSQLPPARDTRDRYHTARHGTQPRGTAPVVVCGSGSRSHVAVRSSSSL